MLLDRMQCRHCCLVGETYTRTQSGVLNLKDLECRRESAHRSLNCVEFHVSLHAPVGKVRSTGNAEQSTGVNIKDRRETIVTAFAE